VRPLQGLIGLVVFVACGDGGGEAMPQGTGATDDSGPGSSEGSGAMEADDGSTSSGLTGSDGDPQGDSSTGEPPDPCGNGVMDPGEACDDANEIDGDGCNADCFTSGQVEWMQTFDSSPTAQDVVQGLAVGASGLTAIVGEAGYLTSQRFTAVYAADGTPGFQLVETGGPEDVAILDDDAIVLAGSSAGQLLVRRISAGGDVVWEVSDPETPGATARSVVLDEAGEILVGGESPVGGMIWRFDGRGAQLGAFAIAETLGVVDVRPTATTLLVAGQTSENTNPFAAELGTDGAQIWWHERNSPPATEDVAASIGVDAAGYVTALYFLPDQMIPVINRFEPGGAIVYQELQPFPDVAIGNVLVDPDGDLFIGGYRYDAAVEIADAWIARVTSDLDLVWEQTLVNQPNNSEARILAFAPDHRLIVTGGVQAGSNDVNVWVARMTE
jgi:cysteine-rich repeat protein